METKKKNPHAGHRERMYNKFLVSGFEGFPDHELIEMLLYSVIPRGNTNEQGHALLDRFGSIRGVVDASFEDIVNLPSVGEKSAMYIKLVAEFLRRYHSSNTKKDKFSTFEKVGAFFVRKYIGMNKETVYVLLLDNALNYIDCKDIYEGTVNGANLEIQKIAQYAYSKNATNVIIAHNHPGGILIPSFEDRQATLHLMNALETLGIDLVEHFIVSGKEYFPIMQNSDLYRMREKATEKLGGIAVEVIKGEADF